MKAKTIKKILKAKINAWAESVTDLTVRKYIEENTIITGGCIASMLLDKEVNDFDIYLNSKEAVLAIAKYYADKVKSFYQIEIIDGAQYPGFDYNAVNEPNSSGPFVCTNGQQVESHQKGRCVHMLDEDRVKLFLPNQGVIRVDKKHYVNEESKEVTPFYPIHFSANAITLTNDIQVVIRFHGDPKKIHENYDFVHATNWYTPVDNHLELRVEALESLITKELRYIGSKYPLTSVIRSKKFIQRGFSIGAGTYLKILYQVSLLNLNDLTVLEDQLAGVDVAYFDILLDALRTATSQEGFVLTYPYLCELIEKIFD